MEAGIFLSEHLAGWAVGGGSLWRSPLCDDFPAMLATRWRRGTRYANGVRSAQTAPASQMTKNAARAYLTAALLGVTGALRSRLTPRDAEAWGRAKAMLNKSAPCAAGSLRDEPPGAKQGAGWWPAPCFGTQRIARKGPPPSGFGPNRAIGSPNRLHVPPAHAARCWQATHPDLGRTRMAGTYSALL